MMGLSMEASCWVPFTDSRITDGSRVSRTLKLGRSGLEKGLSRPVHGASLLRDCPWEQS